MAPNPRHLISYLPDRHLVNLTVGFPERWITKVYPEDGDQSDLRTIIRDKTVCKIEDDMITGLKHGGTPVKLRNYATFPGPYRSECSVYVYPQEEFNYTCKMCSLTVNFHADPGVLPNDVECIPLIKHYHLEEEFQRAKERSGLTELKNLNHSIVFVPKFQTYYDEAELNGVVNVKATYQFNPFEEAPDSSLIVFKYSDDTFESISYFYNESNQTIYFDIDDLSKYYMVTMGY